MEKINIKEIIKGNEIWKGTEFWKNEIEKIGLLEDLPFFNDVITERRPPHIDANYGEPLLRDVMLDEKKPMSIILIGTVEVGIEFLFT